MHLSEFLCSLANKEAMSERSISRLENTRIGKLREIVVDTPTLVHMMVAIERLEEIFGFDREEFFQVPFEYQRVLLSFQLYNLRDHNRMNRDNLVKLSHACGLYFIIPLHKILKLDHLDHELTLKEFIFQIRSIESTSNFFRYLRSTAIVLGNLADFDSHLSTFMILILCPLQKYFIEKGAVSYVGLLSYHGKQKIPDDLTTFEKNEEDFTTDVRTSAAIRNFPFHQHNVLHLAMLIDPYKRVSRDVVQNRIKNDFFLKISRPQHTLFRYQLSQKYEHKIQDEVKYKLRMDSLDEIRCSLYAGYLYDLEKMKDCNEGEKESINHMYDFGFGLIVKWEIAHRLLRKMFSRDTDPIQFNDIDDSGVNKDHSPTPVDHLSIDVVGDGNQEPQMLTLNQPIKLEEADPTVRGYHMIPIGPPPVGIQWNNFDDSGVDMDHSPTPVDHLSIDVVGDGNQGPQMLTPNQPIKLEEADPAVRGYHMIPIGPPPVGWENDPAWEAFNCSSVTYQGQSFFMNTITVFPSDSSFQLTSEIKNESG